MQMTTTPTPRERALAMLALGPVTMEDIRKANLFALFVAFARLTRGKGRRAVFRDGAYHLGLS
jgi:hypothetical protein